MREALRQAIASRVAVKLTLTLVGFVAVVLLAAGLYLNRVFERLAVESLETRLAMAGALLHDATRDRLVRAASPGELYEFTRTASRPTGSRITLIGVDGRVLADSSVAPSELLSVENHAGRPEVRDPLAGLRGRDVRTSATVHEPFLYVGVPVQDGGRVIGVLRFALPLSVVTASYALVHKALLAGALVALAVAVGIAIFVSRRITQPIAEMQRVARRMSEGDFTARAPTRSLDEIGALGRALNSMAARLRDKIEDLEQEQRKVATILDAMVEGVIAVDTEDHVLLINERARALFGLPPAGYEGKPLLEVIRNAELHAVVRETRVATDGVPVRREVRLGGPDERVIQVNAMPLHMGTIVSGVVMVLDDVSELRRLERVRTEFVANVSHEFRTPLTAIQGYVETLLAHPMEAEQRARFLEVVHRHTERLGRLLNDLTDLSNIELGRAALDLEPVMLAEVLESVLTVLRPRADAGGVTIRDELPGDLPAVEADHDRLQQILINLLDNAVKYTPAGGSVTITARLVSKAVGGLVEVIVADTGVGIPPADLPRVTERFYRVDRARSRELGGTGLGLAIVKHLVHAHGGELALESAPGRGTTVRVTLLLSSPTPAQ